MMDDNIGKVQLPVNFHLINSLTPFVTASYKHCIEAIIVRIMDSKIGRLKRALYYFPTSS